MLVLRRKQTDSPPTELPGAVSQQNTRRQQWISLPSWATITTTRHVSALTFAIALPVPRKLDGDHRKSGASGTRCVVEGTWRRWCSATEVRVVRTQGAAAPLPLQTAH